MGDQQALRLLRVLLRVETEVQLGPGVRDDRGRGVIDARGIDTDDGDRRSAPQPLAEASRTHQRQAVPDPGKGAELLLRVRATGPLLAAQPLDGDIAVHVVEGSESREQDEQGVGGGAAELTAVAGLVEGPHLDEDLRGATQTGGEGGAAGADAARVGDDHGVAGEAVGVGRRVVFEHAPVLLLPLQDDLEADRGLPLVGPQHAQVDDDVRLVVGDAAGAQPEPPVDGRGLEGRRLPQALVTGRLDVVVAVEQHGRRVRGRWRHLGDDDRRGVGEVEPLDALDARVAQEVHEQVVGLMQGLRRKSGERDRRDGRQPLQIRPEPVHQRVDAGTQIHRHRSAPLPHPAHP
ncbi:hypothetical protein SAMN02745898_106222 [Streptomyces sp. 136MFCol5.1]|nr:hypothetical protein SAMN02745898_106222 [Streptomyces sp. 136MFCol5.1]